MEVEIRRLGPGDEDAVRDAGRLFDAAPRPDATRRFLAAPDHHLLIAYDAAGVETTHPDKGTEMFLYELGVDEPVRRRGVGTALVRALAALAQERGCHGMWVGAETGNEAAQRTYARAGARATPPHVILEWPFAAPP